MSLDWRGSLTTRSPEEGSGPTCRWSFSTHRGI
nr:MAG TPA: hypothetical protein [Caudoviricetes sp.]